MKILVITTQLNLTSNGIANRQVLQKQSDLILKLSKVAADISKSKEPRSRKVEILSNYLKDEKNELLDFSPLPHPLDPKVLVTGILPDKAMVFKSAMSPLLLCFKTLEDDGSVGEYKIIFKSGDDMRQDQLVLQVIQIMDQLFQKESMVEFVPSMSLAAILAENQNKITNYLQKTWDTSNSELNTESAVMENYVRSCAGYCVITYLLGVGDRHLDNLLLTNNGKLFHVDYGYIMGNDPKPFPPPIKLCKEMVEAMTLNVATNKTQTTIKSGALHINLEVKDNTKTPDLSINTFSGTSTPILNENYLKNNSKKFANLNLEDEVNPKTIFEVKSAKSDIVRARQGTTPILAALDIDNKERSVTPLSKNQHNAAQQVQLNQSQLYNKFKSHCFVAYALLRKPENSRLLISIFTLMAKSGLTDISSEPDRAIMFLENRLKIDFTDETATKYFHSVINDSINALFPQVLETIHKWAQYWRN
ncbi:hypothetical protein BB561_004352 [Smittium simulii]|uniref:PI3K/PI4K catalytic domain-containing protein n=1 Tax=Smittium simulii TaxID=133385 RepID=A0A2T9YGT8_9FUNG|nr:hypothetical protein BB561_004352 [Smittium simulii]